jgi:hypothetical protein
MSAPTNHSPLLLSFLHFLHWQYIAMYGDIGQKSNTMFFSDKPGDVNSLMAQASTIFKATPSLPQQTHSSSPPSKPDE